MEQGEVVAVEEWLRLRAFAGERDVEAAVAWYADAATVVSVDGRGATPYDRDRVAARYDALAAQGDLFVIEVGGPAGWQPVGDVTLALDTLPIVVASAHRRHGIGRSVVLRLADRARVLGWGELRVGEVRTDDLASRTLFEGLGFVPRPDPPPAYVLRLSPLVVRRRG